MRGKNFFYAIEIRDEIPFDKPPVCVMLLLMNIQTNKWSGDARLYLQSWEEGMGREVKRVALDFVWPQDEVWPEYLFNTCPPMGCDECARFRAAAQLPSADECVQFEIDPPEGPGYQMWETTSEGSPISPVFDSPEKLATWLADTGASAFGSDTAGYDEWLHMIVGDGFAMSAVAFGDGTLVNGVTAQSLPDNPSEGEREEADQGGQVNFGICAEKLSTIDYDRIEESTQLLRKHLVTMHDDGDDHSLYMRFGEICRALEETESRRGQLASGMRIMHEAKTGR